MRGPGEMHISDQQRAGGVGRLSGFVMWCMLSSSVWCIAFTFLILISFLSSPLALATTLTYPLAIRMEKFFNTAGPINPAKHYFIPVERRIAVDEITTLIEQEKYFVLHAPRQSGKTTALKELAKRLNASGRYCCLYVNIESAQALREDVGQSQRAILSCLIEAEKHFFDKSLISTFVAELTSPDTLLTDALAEWTRRSALPTILFIDEIDSLIGDSLVSVLRQLRGGYANRPKDFPQSVILCGVRDIRDYRIHASKEKEVVTGGSCFNVNAESLNVGNFTAGEVQALYQQHTDATGQVFTPEATALAYDLTRGQPWLVNALAYEACFKIAVGKDRQNSITVDLIREAKEKLVKRRVTHLDQLTDKLKEPRVRRIISPLIQGEEIDDTERDHIDYCIDLGLIIRGPNGLEIANPIYREVIPRELTVITQINLEARVGMALS